MGALLSTCNVAYVVSHDAVVSIVNDYTVIMNPKIEKTWHTTVTGVIECHGTGFINLVVNGCSNMVDVYYSPYIRRNILSHKGLIASGFTYRAPTGEDEEMNANDRYYQSGEAAIRTEDSQFTAETEYSDDAVTDKMYDSDGDVSNVAYASPFIRWGGSDFKVRGEWRWAFCVSDSAIGIGLPKGKMKFTVVADATKEGNAKGNPVADEFNEKVPASLIIESDKGGAIGVLRSKLVKLREWKGKS